MELKFAIYRRVIMNLSQFDDSNYLLLREVYPINSGSLKLKTSKYSGKMFYRTVLDGDLIFKDQEGKDDYTYLSGRWDDPELRCNQLVIKIYKVCDGEETQIYKGFLNFKSIDRDRCTLTMKTEVFDDYSEILFNWNTEYNAFQCESVQTVVSTQGRLNFYFLFADADPSTGVFPSTLTGYIENGSEWAIWRTNHAYDPADPTYDDPWFDHNAYELGYNWAAYYAAEIVDMPYGQTPEGSDWTAIESTNTFTKYARPWSSVGAEYSFTLECIAGNQFRFNQSCNEQGEPIAYDLNHKGYIRNACNNQYAQVFNTPCSYNVFVHNNQILKHYEQEYTTDRGRRLNDVLACFLDEYGIVRGSQFFGGATTGIGEPDELSNIILFQKSDFKRPGSSEPAKQMMVTFELIDKLLELWNCGWYVLNVAGQRYFIYEHRYFFENGLDYTLPPVVGLDLNDPAYYEIVGECNCFDCLRPEIPQREKFSFAEAENIDCVGADIYYDSACVTDKPGGNILQRNFNEFSSDVAYIMANPDEVGNDGIVVCSCYEDSDQYRIYTDVEGEISEQVIINAPMSWANLHNYYWTYGRSISNGYMNNNPRNFDSYQKNARQKEILIPSCCLEINPYELVRTSMGDGEIETMELDLKTGWTKLTLLYND